MRLDLCSVSDVGGIERVYILLNSIKQTKQDDTIINYRLVMDVVDDKVKQYFKQLQSDDFTIQYIDANWFKQRINPPHRNYFYYIRLLFPTYFKDVDKLLYLDTDLVFLQKGIEQLWNTDITNYSVAAVVDIPVNKARVLTFELRQTKAKEYFNSGVLLMNLKRIRQKKLDIELTTWCLAWNTTILNPLIMDQTLLNYLFRDEVKYLDYKFNDYSLMVSNGVHNCCRDYLKQKYGYQQLPHSVKNAIVLHFLGQLKPWQNDPKREGMFPYMKVAQQIWKNIKQELGKKEIQQ